MHTVCQYPLSGTSQNRKTCGHMSCIPEELITQPRQQTCVSVLCKARGYELTFWHCAVGTQRQEQPSFDWKIQDGLTGEGAFSRPGRSGIPWGREGNSRLSDWVSQASLIGRLTPEQRSRGSGQILLKLILERQVRPNGVSFWTFKYWLWGNSSRTVSVLLFYSPVDHLGM